MQNIRLYGKVQNKKQKSQEKQKCYIAFPIFNLKQFWVILQYAHFSFFYFLIRLHSS